MAKGPDAPKGQLYDLEQDPGEQDNLYLANPELVESLLAQLKKAVTNGHTNAGPKQSNDIPEGQIKLWKGNVAK